MRYQLALITFVFLLHFSAKAKNPSAFLHELHATEEAEEPILVVKGKDNGVVDEWSMWFKGTGTYIYHLCTYWDGPVGGMPSTELFALRGSIQALKVGEQLQFYIASGNCSVTGSGENSAETYSIGDGMFETIYKSPGGGDTSRDKPLAPSELPPSAFANAKLTRTSTGAVLVIDGVPGAHCGEESLYINSTSPTIRITISNAELATWDKLEKNVSNSGPGMDGKGTYAYSVTVTASLPDRDRVEIIGCSELGVGEEIVVTAKASKEGGTYRFWAEPQEMFSIQTNGSSATLRGSSPAHGTLYVEYTGAEGKKAEAKKEAICVQIETYNGGQKIPQIPLFDIDGKKLDGILIVPVDIKPNDAADLLIYVPADPGTLTAVGHVDAVTLQGIRPGKTTLQATTNCGLATGPPAEVEIVNCDDETIARLEKMKKAAIENLVAATRDMQHMAGSKEFEKARDELVSSYVELLAKVGLTIISSGKTKGVVTKVIDKKEIISKAIPLAAEIADKGSAFSEIIGSSSLEELGANVAKPTSGEAFERTVKLKFGDAANDLYGKSLGAITGLVEVGQAADKFYNNVGQLVHHEEVLEKFMKIMEKAERDLKFVKSRQQLCSRQKGETGEPEIPLADLPPLPEKPSPPTKPAPKPVDPPVQEPKNDQSTAEPQTNDDEILVDPEPPTIPPRQVGLPFEPDDCGCNNSKNLTVSSTDFSTLGAGIKNLGECVENFTSISLTDYQKALTELSELTESLSSTLQTDAAAFLVKAKESKPQLDAIVNRVKAYDEASKLFLDNMGKCPEMVTIGMEIFKSVETITIDSVKTNY